MSAIAPGKREIRDAIDLAFAPSAAKVSELQKLGEGRQAELFVWPPGVVKLFRNPQDQAAATNEATRMAALAPTGLPMPRIFGTVTIEGRPGIVMERLTGTDQLTLLGRRPSIVWPAARTLGELHARLHAIAAPDALPALKPALNELIASSDRVPKTRKVFVLEALARLPDGNAVCHGDVHPANAIGRDSSAKIIDWAIVTRGDALADVASTLLIFDAGALPPGAPFVVKLMTSVGRGLFRWRYLRTYRRMRPFDESALAAWRVVAIAARLTHGIAEEREQLLAMLEHSIVQEARPN